MAIFPLLNGQLNSQASMEVKNMTTHDVISDPYRINKAFMGIIKSKILNETIDINGRNK